MRKFTCTVERYSNSRKKFKTVRAKDSDLNLVVFFFDSSSLCQLNKLMLDDQIFHLNFCTRILKNRNDRVKIYRSFGPCAETRSHS